MSLWHNYLHRVFGLPSNPSIRASLDEVGRRFQYDLKTKSKTFIFKNCPFLNMLCSLLLSHLPQCKSTFLIELNVAWRFWWCWNLRKQHCTSTGLWTFNFSNKFSTLLLVEFVSSVTLKSKFCKINLRFVAETVVTRIEDVLGPATSSSGRTEMETKKRF